MKKTISVLVFGLFLFLSCKKEKLEGDAAILVGKWQWVYSNRTYSTCDPPSFEETLTPLTQTTTYAIEFIEKGKIIFYENSTESPKHRIKTLQFDINNSPTSSYPYVFSLYMDDEVYNNLQGAVKEDSLKIIVGFPFNDTGCEDYVNTFVRVE